ncbi:TIGR00730 family Rossman fold protein [Tianweitania populi]|uniref:Cytokinin riboside 5'-monophosphate phosphoribohydrolase n=1 Tax=Tianweitania populi TaxID=1607949 RepID=A0A8J3DSS1_9HYPH|nr:TIGR00730 family Rossman fold protein [Tianweitania populi]GHD06899.1 cytokinin riboside 5'-monophosphate phosphoribohydrolase [Tianweitania populi]
MSSIQSVCVYCGSSTGRSPIYIESGEALGTALAAAGLRLIYGGGTRGIMGAVSAAAVAAGGKVTGIIPTFLLSKEAKDGAPSGLDELHVVDTMHVRKHMMFERSDAFVALPGGIGTVEEIIEIMTWGQLGQHRKPMIFANIDGFWEPMRALIDHMTAEGFIHSAHQVRPIFVDKVEDIIPAIVAAGNASEGDEAVIEQM